MEKAIKDEFSICDKLIFDILYGVEIEYSIKVSKYISAIYKYDRIVSKLKEIMTKGNVKILKEKLIKEIDEVTWVILIHRI